MHVELNGNQNLLRCLQTVTLLFSTALALHPLLLLFLESRWNFREFPYCSQPYSHINELCYNPGSSHTYLQIHNRFKAPACPQLAPDSVREEGVVISLQTGFPTTVTTGRVRDRDDRVSLTPWCSWVWSLCWWRRSKYQLFLPQMLSVDCIFLRTTVIEHLVAKILWGWWLNASSAGFSQRSPQRPVSSLLHSGSLCWDPLIPIG